MPVLINYDRTTQGRCVETNLQTQNTYTYYPQSMKNRELKVGTGPRAKPTSNDETGYERIVQIERIPKGSGSQKPRGSHPGFTFEGDFPFTSTTIHDSYMWPSQDLDSNLLDDASIKAMAKFNQRDMDLGTAWVERGKTADLVRGAAQTAVEALRDIKRRDGAGLLNTLGLDHSGARGRGFVDAYLAFTYGLKPLLNDVIGATQALARLPPERWSVTVTGAAARDYSASGITDAVGYPVSYSRTSRQSCRAKISATQVAINRNQDLQWALGLDNPMGTTWEITPWSFLVDQLVPIGDWLAALNAFKYYKGYTCTYSQFLREDVRWGGASKNESGSVWSTTGKGFGSSLRIKRSITSIPVLGLPIRDPKSIRNMANVLALLASRSANADQPRFIRY